MKGGALTRDEMVDLLEAGYGEIDENEVPGWTLDKEISNARSKVFVRNDAPRTVYIVHRGTDSWGDWGNNAAIPGGKRVYKLLPRYKDATDVQRRANKKYEGYPVNTLSHSQGGAIVGHLVEEGLAKGENITINPAVYKRPKHGSFFIIQSDADPVSVFIKNPDLLITNEVGRPTMFGQQVPYSFKKSMLEAHGFRYLKTVPDFTIPDSVEDRIEGLSTYEPNERKSRKAKSWSRSRSRSRSRDRQSPSRGRYTRRSSDSPGKNRT